MNRFGVSEHEDGYWYMKPDEDGEWVSYQSYQQLMEKAVRFAQYIKDEFTYDDDPRFIEADEFLNSPEVQAWKEQP